MYNIWILNLVVPETQSSKIQKLVVNSHWLERQSLFKKQLTSNSHPGQGFDVECRCLCDHMILIFFFVQTIRQQTIQTSVVKYSISPTSSNSHFIILLTYNKRWVECWSSKLYRFLNIYLHKRQTRHSFFVKPQ